MFDQIGQALSGFMDWASTPAGKAALMGFGNSMLNSGNQGFGAAIGQALGKGAEASTRQQDWETLQADRQLKLEDRQRDMERDDRKLGLDEQRVKNDTRNTDSLIKERARGVSLNTLFSKEWQSDENRRKYVLERLKDQEDPFYSGEKLTPADILRTYNEVDAAMKGGGGGPAATSSAASGGAAPASAASPTNSGGPPPMRGTEPNQIKRNKQTGEVWKWDGQKWNLSR